MKGESDFFDQGSINCHGGMRTLLTVDASLGFALLRKILELRTPGVSSSWWRCSTFFRYFPSQKSCWRILMKMIIATLLTIGLSLGSLTAHAADKDIVDTAVGAGSFK